MRCLIARALPHINLWREDRVWGSEWVAAAVCGAERAGRPVLGDESDY